MTVDLHFRRHRPVQREKRPKSHLLHPRSEVSNIEPCSGVPDRAVIFSPDSGGPNASETSWASSTSPTNSWRPSKRTSKASRCRTLAMRGTRSQRRRAGSPRSLKSPRRKVGRSLELHEASLIGLSTRSTPARVRRIHRSSSETPSRPSVPYANLESDGGAGTGRIDHRPVAGPGQRRSVASSSACGA
jgi:hypothetical protein